MKVPSRSRIPDGSRSLPIEYSPILFFFNKRGHQLLSIRFLRHTTALSADEQSDTHVSIADIPAKCALKAWLAFTHTAGYTFSIPEASNSALSLALMLLW